MTRRRVLGVLFVLLNFHQWRGSGATETRILRLCVSQSSCENCLQASSSCAWCSDWSYSNLTIGRPRCNIPERLREFGCQLDEIRTTPPGSTEYVEDFEFRDMDEGRAPIQLRPQRIRVRIPAHSKITIPVRYRLAKSARFPAMDELDAQRGEFVVQNLRMANEFRYQEGDWKTEFVDLYYLMDLTWTMKEDKDTLVGLGREMGRTLGKITSNFRLGFGSYADKPVMPFIFPGHLDNPCKSMYSVCSPVYSFWHHLELTNDIQRFIKEVNETSVTANMDNLEGALDGLVQAIVCTKEVGWEHQARKIILVATNGHLHFAGDGKLGGAVKRQDFKCHLDERGQYSSATQYDYSSLAELSRLLQERKINLIFAVTENRRPGLPQMEYELTAALLKEKARVATLTRGSSNILEIIESSYHQITSKVILRDNSTDLLRVEYFSNCGKANVSEWKTSECDGVEDGKVYDFNVVLSVDQCPKDQKQWKQTVVIEDVLASEVSKVVVDVEFLCGCNCNESGKLRCEHGTNECGLCKCDIGWSGETCDCDESSPVNNWAQCVYNGGKICSNKGECVCGKCLCDEGFKGEFCECSACDQIDGIECSNRGTCQCGACLCIEGWKGNACQCPSTDELCVAPGSQEVCAGHGYCDCGECRCNVTAADGLYYRGTYCESSISAGGSDLCVLYNPCVNATVEDPENAVEFCQTNVTTYRTERVQDVDLGHEHYCFVKTVKKKTTCILPYVYEFETNNAVILKVAEKRCHAPVHPAIIPSLIVFGTVCFGIVSLLIWKCWTSIQDKREYEKFERERMKTVFSLDENPLFKPATTRFRVPSMYKED